MVSSTALGNFTFFSLMVLAAHAGMGLVMASASVAMSASLMELAFEDWHQLSATTAVAQDLAQLLSSMDAVRASHPARVNLLGLTEMTNGISTQVPHLSAALLAGDLSHGQPVPEAVTLKVAPRPNSQA